MAFIGTRGEINTAIYNRNFLTGQSSGAIPGPTAGPAQPIIGPELPSAVSSAELLQAHNKKNQQKQKDGKNLRFVAGEYWEDKTLDDWPENDFRVFCGDLGNEVTDDLLANAFRKYKSFQRARVIRNKRTGKTRGFGFVSFQHPEDMVLALKEVNGKYVGNRPIRLRKSQWEKRNANSEHNQKLLSYETLGEVKAKSLKKFKKLQRTNEKQAKKEVKKNAGGSGGAASAIIGGTAGGASSSSGVATGLVGGATSSVVMGGASSMMTGSMSAIQGAMSSMPGISSASAFHRSLLPQAPR